MYRIRLTSGEEAAYKTVEELAQAVSSGVISANAEVFHKAGNRWLPINTHPDYRALVTGKRPAVARPSAPNPAPVEVPSAPSDTPTPRASPAIQSVPRQPVQPVPVPETEVLLPEGEVEVLNLDPNPQPVDQPLIPQEPPPRPKRHRSPRPFAKAMGMGALLLTAGGVALYYVVSRNPEAGKALPERVEGMAPAPPVDPGRAPPENATPEHQVPAAAPRLARSDTVAVVYPAPSQPLPPAASNPARPVEPSAPRVVSRLGTTVTRMPSYFEAYADARAEMDEGLDYVNFRRLFAPSRFASPDSLRAARRMVVAAGNILRVYRGREVMLEQTYRPGEPEGRGSLREPFEVAEASRGLLADVDSLFAILVAQEGEVRYRDNALYFQNGRASRAYSDLRRRITQAIAGLGDPPEAADRVTMPRLLRAIGTDRPPPAR